MEGRKLIAVLVGVCVLSALIGSGITLLVKQGPEGPAGATGPPGPRGPRGYSGDETAGLNAQDEAEQVQYQAYELEERIEDLERESSGLEAEEAFQRAYDAENYAKSICRALPSELGVIC